MHTRLRTQIAAAAAVAVGVIAATARGQNLLANPSFETGDFTGWTLGPEANYADAQVLADDVTLSAGQVSNVRSGVFAAVAGDGKSLSLAQTVNVTPNTTYAFGGWVSTGGAVGTLYTNVTLDDTAGNDVRPWVQIEGGTTPEAFVFVRRLFTTGSEQTSATFRVRAGVPSRRFSLDDLVVQAWTAPIASQDLEKLFTVGQASPDGLDSITSLPGPGFLANRYYAVEAGVSSLTTASFVRSADGQVTTLRDGWESPEGNGVVVGQRAQAINDAGQVVVRAGLSGGGGEGAGYYLVDGDQRTTVLRAGQADPGGAVFGLLGEVKLSESGGVAAMARTQMTITGLYLKPAGQPLLKVAREGEPAPGGGNFTRLGDTFALNGANRIAFESSTSSGVGGGGGLFLYNGSTLGAIALRTDPAPGGGNYGAFQSPDINESGSVAFSTANIAGGSGVFVADLTNAVTARVRQGNAAPGGGTFQEFLPPAINESGQVGFIAQLDGGGSGVYRSNPDGTTTLIARAGQTRPDAAEPFAGFGQRLPSGTGFPPLRPSIAAGGQVAFVDYQEALHNEQGIYIGDGTEVIQVARWGYAINGQVVTAIGLGATPEIQLNDFGQVAYLATFADGETSNVLFTPTLHWRSTGSGDWSNASNWTVGLAPAAVHPVVIDSPAGVDVTAPLGDVAVKSLEVGAGNVLTLPAGSSLTATEGVTIYTGGALRGGGTIVADITSDGTIAPGESIGVLSVEGDLTQLGWLELELLGGASDRLVVSGVLSLGGDVFISGSADVGETFTFITAGSVHGDASWHLPGDSTSRWVALPGGGQAFEVTYVPEPAGVGMVFALLAVGRRRPRARRRGGSAG